MYNNSRVSSFNLSKTKMDLDNLVHIDSSTRFDRSDSVKSSLFVLEQMMNALHGNCMKFFDAPVLQSICGQEGCILRRAR